MRSPNKDTVIEALIERFGKPVMYAGYCVIGMSEAQENAALIRASCENIYQWGRLQGMNEALEKMRGEFKGEEVSHD